MVKYLITLDPSDCYGCRACEQICTHKAITFAADDEGFLYPKLNIDLCTDCGLCTKVCSIDTPAIGKKKVVKTIAAQYNNKLVLNASSSGGIFSAAADYILSKGGYVAGCIFDENFNAKHILSNRVEDIERMRGSKYVQSDTGDVYREIRELLKDGKLVLFTGTPCQVAGLYGFLLKNYDNLYTLDLICHGVPSPKFLQNYLDSTYRVKGEVLNLQFRNKRKNGWRSQGSVKTLIKNKEKEIRTSPFTDSYYYYYYLQNSISRMCCYSCQYSSKDRVGDITIGDYWNISDILPSFESKEGVSVALINSDKGIGLIEQIKGSLKWIETSLEDAIRGNGNLSTPCSMPHNRLYIYKKIDQQGYKQVEKEECHYQYIMPMIKRMVPKSLKNALRKLLK